MDEIDRRLAIGREIHARDIRDEAGLKAARDDYYSWTEYNEALLRRSFDLPGPAEEYADGPLVAFVGAPIPLFARIDEVRDDVAQKLRKLRSLQNRLELYQEHPDLLQTAPPSSDPVTGGREVFVVHGQNERVMHGVARFLRRLLGYDPIILHEQPDRGRTIIEKFEEHAVKAAAAVVLLTGDDVGGLKGGPQSPRARQNVVFELGFFIGKIGRGRTIILREPGVESPSELSGVLDTEIDGAGAWRTAVARELEAAGLKVELRALL